MSNVEADKGEIQKQLTLGVASDQLVQPFIISALEEANGGPPAKMPQKAEATFNMDDQGVAHVHTTYDLGLKNISMQSDTTVSAGDDGTFYTKDVNGNVYRKESLAIGMLSDNEIFASSQFSYPKLGKSYDSVALMDLSPVGSSGQSLAGTDHEIIRRDGKVLGYIDSTVRNTGLLDGRTSVSYQVRDPNYHLLHTFRTVEDDQGMQGKIKLEQV